MYASQKYVNVSLIRLQRPNPISYPAPFWVDTPSGTTYNPFVLAERRLALLSGCRVSQEPFSHSSLFENSMKTNIQTVIQVINIIVTLISAR